MAAPGQRDQAVAGDDTAPLPANQNTLIDQLNSKGLWVAISIVVLLSALCDQLFNPLVANVDCAMYLQCGWLLLHGQIPYVDFIDLNPPLVIYLSTIPVLLSGMSMPDSITCFVYCMIGLAVVCLVLSLRLIDRLSMPRKWQIFGPLLVAFSLITATLRGDFGEREHFFVLTYLPFLILRSIRWGRSNQSRASENGSDENGPNENRASEQSESGSAAGTDMVLRTDSPVSKVEAILIGLLTGLGTFIKPYFCLSIAAPELYWLFTRRRLKPLFTPEIFTMVAVALIYLGHFFFCPPMMNERFFNFIVPLVAKGYAVYDSPLEQVLPIVLVGTYGRVLYEVPWFLFAFMLTVCSLAFRYRKRNALLMPLVFFTVGSYAAFVIEHKCWSYHTIPLLSGCFWLAALEFGAFARFSTDANERLRSIIAGALIAVFLLFAGFRASASIYENPDLLKAISAKTEKMDRVLVLCSTPMPAYPLLVQTARLPGSRYLWAFALPMLEHWKKHARSESDAKHAQAEEERVLAEIEKDIKTMRPRLIAIDTGRFKFADDYCTFLWLDQHGFIKRAMKEYKFVDYSKYAYKLYELKSYTSGGQPERADQ